jgi:SET domain-containing protein
MHLIVKTGVSGRGVFAQQPIAPGSVLLHFTGPLLRYEQTTPQTLALQIGPNLYLGASGNMDDFVNHSCNPNCGMVIEGTRVTLIAIRDIAAGEELFFDYSTTMDEDDFEMTCRCGEAVCRKIVRDFKHLSMDLRRKYTAFGIVPEYNLKYTTSSISR